jgi:deazaflavin-dependent oxidoreductase (nitroreductase family)
MTMPDDLLAYNRQLIERWYADLPADPQVTVELPGRKFTATAVPLSGADYDREWARVVSRYPFFAEHQLKAGDRKIPMVELSA